MRIGLISHEYPSGLQWGNSTSHTYHLSRGLAQLGHDVEIVSLVTDSNNQSIHERIKLHHVLPYEFRGNLPTIDMYMPHSLYVLKTASALWNKLVQIHKDKPFDIIDSPELLAQSIYPALTNVAPLIVRFFSAHTVGAGINTRPHSNADIMPPSFDHELIAAAKRLSVSRADALIASNNIIAQNIADDLHLKQEQIRIISNPIDSQEFSPLGHKAIKSDGRLTVLFVGNFQKQADIQRLREVISSILKLHPAVRFIVMGDYLKQQNYRFFSKTQDHITWVDKVSLKDLPAYYRSADICVVSSSDDNATYRSLEAMACGLPLVTIANENISETIIELIQDEKQRLHLGQNARNLVLEKFSHIKIAEQTAELYRSAINTFSTKQGPSLYLKPAQQVLTDAEEFVHAFDKTISDFLSLHSWRFRFNRWWQHLLQRI